MIEWLKHHIVPQRGNDHRPRLLRKDTARAVLGILVFVELLFIAQAFFILPSSDYFAAVISSAVVSETNRHRAGDALLTLTPNPLLEEAAQRKAEDMALKGYFSHVSPTGEQPWKWLREVGYYYNSAGENLAVNFVDSKDVTDAWMNSPTHKANILNGKFTEIGIGVSEGMYQGQKTVFVVQFFGRPYEAPPVLIAGAKTTSTQLPVLKTKIEESLPKVQEVNPKEVEKVAAIPSVAPQIVQVVTETDVYTEKPAQPATTTILGTETEVRGGEISSPPVMFSLLLTNPETTTKAALLSLTVLLAIATTLTIVVRKEKTHYDLIANGLTLVAIILFVVLLNNFISTKDFLVL